MTSTDIPKLVLGMFALYCLITAVVGSRPRRARWLAGIAGVLCLGLLGSLVAIDHYLAHRAAQRQAHELRG